MICPNCGRENAADARFCSNCGIVLTATGAPSPVAGQPPPPPPPPALPPALGPLAVAGWEAALRLGSWALLTVGLIGQALAWGIFAATHVSDVRSLGVVNTLRLGGFYFYAFHHVSLTFTGDVPISTIPGATGGRFEFGFAIALLIVTWLAARLLFRFGARVANAAGGEPWARAIHGAKVAIPYALFSLILSFVLPFSIPTATNQTSVHVGVGHIGAFVLPLVLGILAGGLGGLLSAGAALDPLAWGRHAVGAIVSGWRMFAYGLLFAFVSLLVMAAINPSTTSAVVRGETDRSGGYGLAMVHHLLALPNQSMLVLVPAMGGCDGIYAAGGPAAVKFDLLCYSHFPRGDRRTPLRGGTPFFGASTTQIGGGLPSLPFGFGRAPAVYFLFLLVPAATVLLGGAGAARRMAAASVTEGLLAGALAGMVFGVLVALGSWLGGVGVSGGGGVLGFDVRMRGTFGPRIGTGLLFGLLWGVVGGAIGGALFARRGGAPAKERNAEPAAGESEAPPPRPL